MVTSAASRSPAASSASSRSGPALFRSLMSVGPLDRRSVERLVDLIPGGL
jgi:hypothetical protein